MPWQSVRQSAIQILSKFRNPGAEATDPPVHPWRGRIIDLHSHVLPGLDDGAADWSQSLEMCRLAVAEGIAEVVCTPHWVYGLYDNTRDRILHCCGTLQRKLVDSAIPLKVHPGCEIRLEPDILPQITSGRLLTLNDTGRYALIELPGEFLHNYVENCFRNLMDQGITPVLSHPERNPGMIRCPERLAGWVGMGVLCQITAASLRGKFGPLIQRFTVTLIQHQLVHFMATDAHAPHVRSPRLSEAVLDLVAMVGPEAAERMVVSNPRAVLAGEKVDVPEPTPLSAHPSCETTSWWRFLTSRR
jgi:protein-tyrosine phosphatase